MTGLLHRLAARATNDGWTVRSDARLPFGAHALGQAPDTAPRLVDAAGPATRAQVRAGPGTTAPATAVPPQAALPPARTPGAAARPGSQGAQGAQDMAAVPAPLMPAAAEPAAQHAARGAATLAPPEARPGAATPAMAFLRTDDRPRLSQSLSEEPALLMPPQPSTAGHAAPQAQAVQGAAAFAIRAAPQAGASGETEVHIHIGRIEVTALQEAPLPKAGARERAPAMSLDAYLAARSKA
jgi:hypothetical protein